MATKSVQEYSSLQNKEEENEVVYSVWIFFLKHLLSMTRGSSSLTTGVVGAPLDKHGTPPELWDTQHPFAPTWNRYREMNRNRKHTNSFTLLHVFSAP